jgi:O-antigen/teichoic acid export membrane protein
VSPDHRAQPQSNASGRQLLRNVASGYLGLVISLLLSLFLTPIALHKLGNSEYGLWIAISTFGSYFTLLGAGVSTAAVQRVATCIALGDDDRLAEVLATTRAFFWVSGALALVLTAAFIPFIGSLFHAVGVSRDTEELALLLTGFFSGTSLLTSTPASAVYGSGRSSRLAVINTLVTLSIQTVQITVILLGGGLLGLFVVSAVGSLGTFLATDLVARRSGLMRLQRGRATRSMLRELLRTGRLNVVVALSSTVAYQLDAVTIGVILPVRQVAPYDFALSTSGLTQSVATAGTGLLVPTYAHSSALEDRGRQFRLYSRAVLTSMALSIPIVVALGFFGQTILGLWLHRVPEHTYEVMIILNCVIALQLPGLQSFLLLIGIGRSDLVAKIAVPASLLNLIFSVIATYRFGPAGPAIGSIPQVLFLELTALPVVVCRILGMPYRRFLREAMAPLAVPITMAAGLAVVLSVAFGRGGKVLAPIECVIVCVVGWTATGLTLMKTDPELRAFVRRATHRRIGAHGPR